MPAAGDSGRTGPRRRPHWRCGRGHARLWLRGRSVRCGPTRQRWGGDLSARMGRAARSLTRRFGLRTRAAHSQQIFLRCPCKTVGYDLAFSESPARGRAGAVRARSVRSCPRIDLSRPPGLDLIMGALWQRWAGNVVRRCPPQRMSGRGESTTACPFLWG